MKTRNMRAALQNYKYAAVFCMQPINNLDEKLSVYVF